MSGLYLQGKKRRCTAKNDNLSRVFFLDKKKLFCNALLVNDVLLFLIKTIKHYGTKHTKKQCASTRK